MPTILCSALLFIAAGDVELTDRSTPCGLTALSVSTELEGRAVTVAELRERFSELAGNVHSLDQLARAASALHFHTRFVRLDRHNLLLPNVPVIASVRPDGQPPPGHFVVLYGSRNGRVQMIDSPRGVYLIEPEALARGWDGRGLVIVNSPDRLAPFPADTVWRANRRLLWSLLTAAIILAAWYGPLAWRAMRRQAVGPAEQSP